MSNKIPADKAYIKNEVEKRLLQRFAVLDIDPVSKRGGIEECAFLAGAASALRAAFGEGADLTDYVPADWVLMPISGKSLVAELRKAKLKGSPETCEPARAVKDIGDVEDAHEADRLLH